MGPFSIFNSHYNHNRPTYSKAIKKFKHKQFKHFFPVSNKGNWISQALLLTPELPILPHQQTHHRCLRLTLMKSDIMFCCSFPKISFLLIFPPVSFTTSVPEPNKCRFYYHHLYPIILGPAQTDPEFHTPSAHVWKEWKSTFHFNALGPGGGRSWMLGIFTSKSVRCSAVLMLFFLAFLGGSIFFPRELEERMLNHHGPWIRR